MCLGIPMQIQTIDGYLANCEAKGVTREVNLFMMQDQMPAIGDFITVHLGYAVNTMSEQEAEAAWEIYDQMLAAEGE